MKSKWNKPLRNAVESGSVERAQSAIITHVDDDSRNPTMVALEIADEVAKVLPNLYEEDNGRFEVPAEDTWDVTFWNRTKAALGLNFSREKIELATRVALYLRSQGILGFQPTDKLSNVKTTSGDLPVGAGTPRRPAGKELVAPKPHASNRGEGSISRENLGKKFPWIPTLIAVGALVAVCVAVCCLKKA